MDGFITAADSQLAFAIVIHMVEPTYEEWCAADCNDDGFITAGDSQTIFALIFGLDQCADPIE